MMNTLTVLLYAAACFSVTVTPGPTMLLALSNGTLRNPRVVLMGILGAALSDLILIGTVSLGLGALLMASRILFLTVKSIGIFYLLWLAIQLWRSQPKMPDLETLAEKGSARKAFLRSLYVALSNPNGLFFFSAFLPQFIDLSRPQAFQYFVFALLTALLDMGVMLCYAGGGVLAARLLTLEGIRCLNRICAALLASFAAGLTFYRRSHS